MPLKKWIFKAGAEAMPLWCKASIKNNVVQSEFILYDVTGLTRIRHSIPVATLCTTVPGAENCDPGLWKDLVVSRTDFLALSCRMSTGWYKWSRNMQLYWHNVATYLQRT